MLTKQLRKLAFNQVRSVRNMSVSTRSRDFYYDLLQQDDTRQELR
jgi:isovaleryl-CoA dehydrogenase